MTISTAELVERSGCSFRQIDHWCRKGYIVPVVKATGSGSRRRWAGDAVHQCMVLGAVSAALGEPRTDGGHIGASSEVLAGVAEHWNDGCLMLRNGVTLAWLPPGANA